MHYSAEIEINIVDDGFNIFKRFCFQDYKAKKKVAHALVSSIAKETIAADHINTKLNKSWDKSFTHRVSDLCVNMLDNNNYTKVSMDKFLKAELT